jgi:hypothetical protein
MLFCSLNQCAYHIAMFTGWPRHRCRHAGSVFTNLRGFDAGVRAHGTLAVRNSAFLDSDPVEEFDRGYDQNSAMVTLGTTINRFPVAALVEGCAFVRNTGRALADYSPSTAVYSDDANLDTFDYASEAPLRVDPPARAPPGLFLTAEDAWLLQTKQVPNECESFHSSPSPSSS